MSAVDVLPARYIASVGSTTICPCQYGPSGHCNAGNHPKCPRTWGWERHGQPEPETHIVSRDYGALTPVWRTGQACRWLCPCTCHTNTIALFEPPARRPGSLSVTGGNGYARVASMDNTLAVDDDQPTLWDPAPTIREAGLLDPTPGE